MRVAISASGPALDAEADPRFGRCQYFIIADPETLEFEAVDNSSAMASGGAGISAAQAIAGKGVQAVLTGNCGPNAYQVLSSAGIEVITGVSGKVKDVVEGYRSGKFTSSAQANVPDHYGMGATPGRGGGLGMGRGKGCGMGRGMRTGSDMTSPPGQATLQQSPEEELQALKSQSETMAKQLNDIQRRIDDLERNKGQQ